MKKKFSAVLGMGVAAIFFMMLLGISACAPTMESAGKAAKAKKGKKKAAANTLFSCTASAQKTCFAVSPTPVKPKKGKVWIAGSGFKPKQELVIRLMMGGVLSDISFMVKPRPITNKYGAFYSVWKLKGREFKRKLLKPGSTVTVTLLDQDGNTLGTAPLVIDKAKKKGKKKKRK